MKMSMFCIYVHRPPHQALVNAVVVKSLFKGYDINNSGCVPLEDFMRGLNQLDQTIVQKEGLALAKVNDHPREEKYETDLIPHP
jgi:hypothetical protein